ncbi:hypothetical protein [Corynebacterium felinum]|uniref:MFS family permease n=1 Tax=Corynebacterium felinum TaxID=131318 RepID=A0ABU2B8H3_9CORY|nr:hypothetical protein [Corynebacterium felinum]MDR7354922.1 MFS family permease [Corynebacterium felinum]
MTKPYRALEHYEYGTRISWSIKHWLNSFFTRQTTPQAQASQQQQSVEESTEYHHPQVSGLASLRYVKHIKIILLLMVIEALGNRARESFDVYFITDTLGRGVADLGILTTVLSVGLAIGSFASGWARKVISWQLWPSAVYVGFGLCFAAKGLATSWWLVLLFTAGEGLCLGLNSGLFQAAKMKFTPAHLVGSTSTAFTAVFQAASTAGLALWAAYAWIGSQVSPDYMHTWGYRIAFIVGGLGIAVAGLLSPKLYRHLNWHKT